MYAGVTTITRETRHLPIPFATLNDVLTLVEVDLLRDFALNFSSDATEDDFSVKHELPNRPTEWDPHGLVMKLQDQFRDYIQRNFFILGSVEPRYFTILRTDELQSYVDKYSYFENGGYVLYTAIIPLSHQGTDYTGGDLTYMQTGEGGSGKPGQMLVHRNETLNSWALNKVESGIRIDLVLVQHEIENRTSYTEFEMEQTIDDGMSY